MVVDASNVPEADRTAAFQAVVDRAAAEPDVTNAQQAGLNPAGDTALVSVTPKSSPISEDTQNLVTALRDAGVVWNPSTASPTASPARRRSRSTCRIGSRRP